MTIERFVRRSPIAASAEDLYRWHESPGALARLTPPWEPVEVLGPAGIREGQEVTLRVRAGPLGLLRIRWVSRLFDVVPGRQFKDVQVRGPFARWQHTHRMKPAGPHASFLEDEVEYALPFGWLGHLVAGALVRRRLERMFAYRHRVTIDAFASGAQPRPSGR
jgi:ligand-binding SRPBCC domain-containing protein